MRLRSLLIANRGEIAVRIARTAAELGMRTVSVFSEDDTTSLHVRRTDASHALRGGGPAAYLDIAQIVRAALENGCDAVHPGYGFLSENPAFARACVEAGLVFVGPPAELLDLYGDKVRAKSLAAGCGVPLAAGIGAPARVEDIQAFLRALGPGAGVMIKAVAGGGGRGMRAVTAAADVAPAHARCQSEALRAFGNGDVYAERLIPHARHIEVQILGDGTGAVTHLWERECTLQRRSQKLVEIAPSPGLQEELRQHILAAALRMAADVRHAGLATFEFLVDPEAPRPEDRFVFIECNPRLQVEHTVTEAVTGLDLVRLQLLLASDYRLDALGLTQDRIARPVGHAMQLRINMETMRENGQVLPSGGSLRAFDPPSGRGVRVDTFGYAGYTTATQFDSLLAKLIVHVTEGGYGALLTKAERALREFRIEGVATNNAFLQSLLQHPDVIADRVHTTFVEQHVAELAAQDLHRPLFFPLGAGSGAQAGQAADAVGPPGTLALASPMQGRVVSIEVGIGDAVRQGQDVAVIEAMKSELVIVAEHAGIIRSVAVGTGEIVMAGAPLLFVEPGDVAAAADGGEAAQDLDAIRPDLAEVLQRHAALLDATRPEAVARRRKTGQRTARENVADLCDTDSFIEYGGLTLAMQRSRHSTEELIRMSPADGFVTGIGSVNGTIFGDEAARCMVLAYDYTVFAGTQGFMAHRKKDRMFELAFRIRTPVVLFSEGGGGRPGDTDYTGASGLELRSFWHFARLSGLVPLVGINSGRCFAGNATFLGCCDVIIATRNSTIGMAGPAMIEGGGLGVVTPEEVGPVSVQVPNGVIDVLVEDEAEAVRVAKQYLAYFQGKVSAWSCADQRRLRPLVPVNRLRAYDIRKVLGTLADTGSVLELRPQFGVGMITAFIRVEGRPLGVIANNPMHLGGAVDAPGADKAARLMQVCDAFDIPLLVLCDTPGFMVGTESEKTATVRHFARMFVTAASLDVPVFTVVLRKAYGLGGQAMATGYLNAGLFAVSWPTGELGPMGLEGAVRLAYRKELAAIEDPAARQARYQELVDELYRAGKPMNAATYVELDDVIDPAETRGWIVHLLRTVKPPPRRQGKKRPMVDAW